MECSITSSLISYLYTLINLKLAIRLVQVVIFDLQSANN